MRIFITLLLVITAIQAFRPEYARKKVCDIYIHHNHTNTFCTTQYGNLVEGLYPYSFQLEDLPQILFGRNVRDEDMEAARIDLCRQTRLKVTVPRGYGEFDYTDVYRPSPIHKTLFEISLSLEACLRHLAKLETKIKKIWIDTKKPSRTLGWQWKVECLLSIR